MIESLPITLITLLKHGLVNCALVGLDAILAVIAILSDIAILPDIAVLSGVAVDYIIIGPPHPVVNLLRASLRNLDDESVVGSPGLLRLVLINRLIVLGMFHVDVQDVILASCGYLGSYSTVSDH